MSFGLGGKATTGRGRNSARKARPVAFLTGKKRSDKKKRKKKEKVAAEAAGLLASQRPDRSIVKEGWTSGMAIVSLSQCGPPFLVF